MTQKNKLPDGWEEVELFRYLELVSSGIKRFSGIKKYIDTGSLETGKIKDSVEVTYEDRPSRANMGVKEGDVLSAKMKDTEKIYLVSKEDSNHIYSTGFAVLRIKDNSKLIPKYIYYWLKTENFQKLKNRECTGATQKAIGETKLKKFTIVVPPLEIQKKIVTLLEKVEQAKELRKEADGTYMNFLNSLFLEYFGHPFDNKNRNKKMELRDVIEIIVPTRDKPKSFTGNIPWVTLPDLNSSIYIRDAKCRLTKEEAKPTKTRLFPKETVILSCAGSLGKVAIASKEIYTNQQFYGLVCDKSKILPEFLAFQLLLLGEDYYKSIGGTSTLTFFKKETALSIEVIVPDIKLQEKFNEVIKNMEGIKSQQKHSKEHLDNLFNVLMQKAFKGELVT